MDQPTHNGKPPSVAVVSHYALPHIGGIEIVVDREIRALAAAGFGVTLITTAVGGDGGTPAYPPNVRVARLPAWNGLEARFHTPYPVIGPSALVPITRLVAGCDVVHVHGAIYPISLAAVAAARALSKFVILMEHSGPQQHASRAVTLASRLAFEALGRFAARASDRLVSVNARVTAYLERLAGTRRKTLFLPNPVDPDVYHPPTPAERRRARQALGWADGRPKVLFVGRLTRDKGVDVLLQAADPGYDLVFMGPGDPGILGPLPRRGVTYLPPRPPAGTVPVYHAADVLALPSRREGFPLVVQEALACGLGVVTTYDRGYEPYHPLDPVRFCDRTPGGVARAIRSALSAGPPADPIDHICPPPGAWVRRLLAGVTVEAVSRSGGKELGDPRPLRAVV
jgi:glycosyltransferase involved in cell wall biosynthesis